MRCFFPTLFLFLLSSICFSQSYSITHLNMKHGLSNDYIVDIEGDKNGYIWFATEEGLNRYDGNTVIPFYKNKEDNHTALNGNELNRILDDPIDNILWIATKREGLSAYNYTTHTFTTYTHKKTNSISDNAITDIEPAFDGNLWIATYNQGVDYFNKKTKHFTPYNKQTVTNLISNYVWDIVDDGNGKLYIGHKDAGLSIIDIKTKEATNYQYEFNNNTSIPSNDVRCIYKDKSGSIWVGTDKGLALFNPLDGSFINFGIHGGPLSKRITDIAHFSDHNLWVTTQFDGIVKIDLTQRFISDVSDIQITQIGHHTTSNPHLSSLNTQCLYQDAYHNIWAGTWGGGVNFLTQTVSAFNTLMVSNQNLPGKSMANATLSICKDRDGALWVGTYSSGIFQLINNNVVNHFIINNSKSNVNTVQIIHCDKKNNLWFGMIQGGVVLYNKSTLQLKQLLPENLKNSDVTAICETNDHRILVGTNDNGVLVFNAKTYSFLGKLNVDETLIRSIIIDDNDNILIGTYGIGMRVYSKNLELLHSFHVRTNFISNTINHIYKDSKGKIWVATGNGLIQFKNGYKADYTTFKKANNNTRSVIEDKSENMWYSTNKGISCIKQDNNEVLHYDHKDNITTSSFSSACVLINAQHDIYFGSMHGICFFNPSQVLAKQKTPNSFFSLVNVFEPIKGQFIDKKQRFISNNSVLELDHTQSNFKVSFGIKDHSLKNQIEYSYMLQGLSESWYAVPGLNEITFRNLAPGTYKLLLRTRIRNQDWSTNYTTLKIIVNPPFWLTWWAKLIYAILALLIALGFMHYHIRKIRVEYLYQTEKQKHEQDQTLNDERLRFYTNITHELRTPLTLILGPIEDMLNSPTIVKKDKKRIALIHKNTLRLRNLVNRLLDFRKTETANKNLVVSKSNIVSVVTDIAMRFKELNQNRQVDILIKTSENNIPLVFDKEAIIMILDNLISNAIKYTLEGSITISISKRFENNEHYIDLNVKDTGSGISENDLPKIFDRYYQKEGKQNYSGTGIGLALVKNLVTLHEGLIRLDTSKNTGTSISVLLKENNTYPDAAHGDDDDNTEELLEHEIGDFEEDYKVDDTVVLIVEDNEDICEYIDEELKSTYEVLIARDGNQGLNIALNSIPDIIISDVMMPEMDGLELCERLKEDMRTCHIPLILLTAKDSSLNKEEGYKAGADSYLTKPFSSRLLKSRLKNLISQRDTLAKKYSGTAKNLPDQYKTNTTATQLSGLDKKFLEKATKLITENIEHINVDVKYLSEHMFMSSSTLYRKMKAITNLSPNEFIRKTKIKESEKLLLERQYTLSEIAYKVGINSQVYFRKCFKKEFGCTPTEYLKRCF